MDTLDTPGDAPDALGASDDHSAIRPLPSAGRPADEADLPAEMPAPIGASPQTVRLWFDAAAEAIKPDADGSLASAKESTRAYRSRAKADNTRSAYRSAVRAWCAWCAWCATHGLIPLPASPLDVAAFLAQERDRGLAANTLDLRRAAIRFLHRAAGCPSPTEDAHVAETLAGIRRDAPNPTKKRAATLTVLRELLAPIPVDASAPGGLAGLRDRALLLVGFAGVLRAAPSLPASAWPISRAPTAASGSPCPAARDPRPPRSPSPALRPHRAVPGARALGLAGGRQHRGGGGVPAAVAAAQRGRG